MRTQVMVLERFRDMLCVVSNFFADRANFHLHRSEPKRKRPRIVFDQNAEEALDGAEQRAMNHQRLMFCAVLCDILQSEARGQIEIELYRGELPGTPDGIDKL